MGGSFNPAHRGHLHVAMSALRRLGLDEVWWLVSPQNPLKSSDGMADFESRMASAQRMARHPRIRVRDIESRLDTRFTTDTVLALIKSCPNTRFVWVMGGDNLAQLHRWNRWERLIHSVPVAIFARPTYVLRALSSVAAGRMKKFRLAETKARDLADRQAPCWIYFSTRLDPTSATQIRASAEGTEETHHTQPV